MNRRRQPCLWGRSALALLLLVSLAAAAGATPPASTVADRIFTAGFPEGRALEDWPAGPVRYILNGPEITLFKSLGTDTERRAFIKQFWLRRDPNTRSMENEFRFEFWKRVFEANQLFTRAAVPGWRSDRGRFYILLGPPDGIETETMPNRRGGVSIRLPGTSGTTVARRFGADPESEGFYGLQRWTYRSRPSRRLPPNFVLAFRLTSAGDFELSTAARDWTLFSDMFSELVGPVDLPEVLGPSDPAAGTDILALYNDVAVALDFGTLSRLPAPEDLLGELVTSEEFFGLIPFVLQTDFYKTAGTATLAVFTIGVEQGTLFHGQAPPALDLLAMGKLENVENPDLQLILAGADALTASPDNGAYGLLLFQVVKAVPPGSYNASFGIMDRNRQLIGSYRERIRVPAFADAGLSLSSLSLARRLLPVSGDLAADVAAAPFRLGNYEVVPKTEPRFHSGEDFSIYYQVYGAATDPRTGALNLAVSYRFFVLADGRFEAIGRPIRLERRDQAVQGWTFPLQEWPIATFRLEITVEDTISGQVAVGQTLFGVEEPDSTL